MSTSVTITIQGLSVLFFKDPEWNVVFLCDDCHKANIRDLNNPLSSSTPLTFQGINAVYDLKTQVIPTTPTIDHNRETLFNMSADYAHNVDGSQPHPQSNLILRQPPTAGTDLVSMKFKDVDVSVTGQTSNDYYVQALAKTRTGEHLGDPFPGAPVAVIGPVGNEVTIKFETPDGIIWSTTGPTPPSTLSFPQTAGKIDLLIDNDCHNSSDPEMDNDFLKVYHFVKDKRFETIQFVAGQVRRSFFNNKILKPKFQAHPHPLMIGDQTIAQQGNCDPIFIDPPPGP